MTQGVNVQSQLRELVAAEVRAELARRMMTGADLAQRIGRSPMYVSRRIRGEVAFDLDDLQRIGEVFGKEPADLLPKAGPGLKEGYGIPAPRPPRSAIVRKVDPRPIDRGPRSPSAVRPISSVPVTKRRPGPVRPMAGAR